MLLVAFFIKMKLMCWWSWLFHYFVYEERVCGFYALAEGVITFEIMVVFCLVSCPGYCRTWRAGHRSASAFPVSDQTHSSICFGMCLCLQGRVWWLLCCLPTALFSHGILKAFRFKINNMHNSSVYQTKKISPPKHVISKIIAFPVFFFLVHSAIYFQLTVSVSLAHILKCRLVGGFHFSLKNVICWFWTGSPLSF